MKYVKLQNIFGDYLYLDENAYAYLMKKLDLPQGFEHNILDKEKMDKVILEYYKEYDFEGMGWDYEIQDCLLEIENDKIIKVWY